MKQAFQRYFTTLMAIVVLVASMGFGVVEHRCVLRGKSLHLIGLEKKGCHGCTKSHTATLPSNQTSVQKKPCCDDQQRYEHLETSSSLAQYVAKFLKITADSIADVTLVVASYVVSFVKEAVSPSAAISSFSSLFYGRSMLSWVKVLVI